VLFSFISLFFLIADPENPLSYIIVVQCYSSKYKLSVSENTDASIDSTHVSDEKIIETLKKELIREKNDFYTLEDVKKMDITTSRDVNLLFSIRDVI
jgi:hypothetical protein